MLHKLHLTRYKRQTVNHKLTPSQLRAKEIFINSAILENNFTPHSEVRIAKALEAEGYEGSSSSIGRWKKKFKWQELLNAKIAAALSSQKEVKDIIRNGGLEATVQNTKVDVKRNSMLIAGTYQFLEQEVGRILQNIEETGRAPTEDEFDRMYKIARLSTDRHDKMLDRLANMPPESISAKEVLERLKNIPIEYEEVEEETITIKPNEED